MICWWNRFGPLLQSHITFRSNICFLLVVQFFFNLFWSQSSVAKLLFSPHFHSPPADLIPFGFVILDVRGGEEKTYYAVMRRRDDKEWWWWSEIACPALFHEIRSRIKTTEREKTRILNDWKYSCRNPCDLRDRKMFSHLKIAYTIPSFPFERLFERKKVDSYWSLMCAWKFPTHHVHTLCVIPGFSQFWRTTVTHTQNRFTRNNYECSAQCMHHEVKQDGREWRNGRTKWLKQRKMGMTSHAAKSSQKIIHVPFWSPVYSFS